MSDQPLDPFSAGGAFCANPHLYDYLHNLIFDPAGTLEMNDGAGQVINTVVKGRFFVETLDPSTFQVNFTDLVELDPYYRLKRFRGLESNDLVRAIQQKVPYEEGDIRSRPDPFSVIVTREEGIFPIRKQVVWKIKDEQDWPYELYRVRYQFSSDPLEAFQPNRRGNLYFMTEAPEPDTRLYYRVEDRQQRTARELIAEGIALEMEP